MSAHHSTGVPKHLGLILDGNRRWAKAQGIPQLEGHRKGYENIKTIAKAAINRGVETVSAYVFSTENWQRSQEEVSYLMRLLEWVVKNEIKELDKENIRVRFIGAQHPLSVRMLKAIRAAEEKTQNNSRGTVAFCLNYGGHQEIVDATKRMIADGIDAAQVSVERIGRYLYAPEIPPVDLIIRTSGEQRLSNFMLWRAAYSELLFVDKHWPAFTEDDLDTALAEYAHRQRRFGV